MNTHISKKQKVFVGLSGGVDSAVSAAILKKQGYDVTGVFIKVWQPDWIECSSKEDRYEAMRVAAHLEIPFVTLDLEKEYKEGVIDYMIAEYSAGRTPNPDVMCNREVKFGAFWHWAKGQGADYVATGHYAQVYKNNNRYSLLTGNDQNKDQSYFLWTLNQADLEHIIFPVGKFPKKEVRNLAKKFKLPNAERKDSQGLCFIGKIDIKEFLTHYIETKEGQVQDEKGNIIGTHPGSLLFTIGERHGFTITKKTPNESPYYVVAKDTKKNILVVSHKETKSESSVDIELTNCNWIEELGQQKTFLARTRYRQTLTPIEILETDGQKAKIRFDKYQDLTPGQSLVIYDGQKCIGGGIIA